MAVVRATERMDFTFEAGNLASDALRVLRFRGTEGISQLFQYDIDLTSPEADVDFDAVVGEKAALAWKTADGERWVHGIVGRFEMIGKGKELTHYTAQLVPRVWSLRLRRKSRIFQNAATPDILKKVLTDGGIPADLFKIALKRSYKPRKYCVQYRESDFDFLSRLMEEEGIFYYFDHTSGGHVMVMGDDSSSLKKIAGEATVPYKGVESGLVSGDQITGFRFSRSMRVGAVVLRDFDFKKPALDLKVGEKAEQEAQHEYYEYPGTYPDSELGKEYARIRLEEQRAERELGAGESNCRRLIAGYRFSVEDHPRDDANQEYLLLRIHHWGDQPQAAEEEGASTGAGPTYQNAFDCAPAKVPHRPGRYTPVPRIEGPQTAIVTGPPGEEIHTDEHGRIKVQFHWDLEGKKDDKTSCWVRVSQGWGGAGWGSLFIPRIGQEVVVEFLEGDPDCPLVTGRVYNGDQPPPYGLPGAKTRSTVKSSSTPGGGGFNELRFEDAKGSEEIFLHGEKDWNVVIKNDRTKNIGHDESTHVKNNRTESVDADEKITIGGNRTESVAKAETISIGGSRSKSVAKDENLTIEGGQSLSVGKGRTVTVGESLTRKVGKDEGTEIGGGRTESVAKNESVEIGQNRKHEIGKDDSLNVGQNQKIRVEKSRLLDVGDNLTIQAGKEIVLKAGSAKIVMKQSGDIQIEGGDIKVKGSGNLTLKGSKITQN